MERVRSLDVQTFDAIVVGVGGFGSSCLYHLARRGCRVLGLDQFPAGHDRGSSHGETRIIRQAYFEHSDYVPLLKRSYELWEQLEAETGRSLMSLCGLMLAGPENGEVVPGVRESAQRYGIPIEQFTSHQATQRFPGFRFTDELDVVFEPGAGYLLVEDCVRTHVESACRSGAVFSSGEVVQDWESDGRTVRVTTNKATYEAGCLILTPGAWAGSLLKTVAHLPPLVVRRKVVLWNSVRSSVYALERGGVGFLFELPYGVFYGFPAVDGRTLKFGEHSGGEVVADPLHVDRSLRDSDLVSTMQFIRDCLPDVETQIVSHSVCMYTMTPDAHFIVDRHTEYHNVYFGAGFSGHGFKFTSAIGEVIADWALRGATSASIGFLSLQRFKPVS